MDIRLRKDECSAWDADDTFVWTTACGGEHLSLRFFGNIDADNGEVTVFEFENVGAAAAA